MHRHACVLIKLIHTTNLDRNPCDIKWSSGIARGSKVALYGQSIQASGNRIDSKRHRSVSLNIQPKAMIDGKFQMGGGQAYNM